MKRILTTILFFFIILPPKKKRYEATKFNYFNVVFYIIPKFDIELFPISVYSNDRENYHERHRMPSKKPLKVFCEDGMIHFTNVPTSCRIVFKNEQGEILCQFSFNATFFTIEKPASAACLEIYYGDSTLRGFIS